MVDSREVDYMVQQEQLINTASLFIKLGKMDQARVIIKRLVDSHRARLIELSRIELTDDNKCAVMRELNEIQFLTKVGNDSK